MENRDLMPNPKINPVGFLGASNDSVMVPAHMVPAWNVWKAFQENKAGNLLINTWGGLGDQICSEPAIRWGLNNLRNAKISLASRTPSIFSHLKFEKVYDTRVPENYPKWNDYLIFQAIVDPTHILWQFVSHMLVHQVDFPSLSMWRSTLHMKDKEITLPDFPITDQISPVINKKNNTVVVHAGKHWQSKTFPKSYWDAQIRAFQSKGFDVALIGANVDENVGYVDVDATGCVDLRDKLDIPEFVAICKNAGFIFSNDSSPIHAAAAGDAFIGFVASVKHPDYLIHWRKGQFGYKTKSFELDGAWNYIDHSPIQEKEVKIESLPPNLMDKLLPKPEDVADYYLKVRNGQ